MFVRSILAALVAAATPVFPFAISHLPRNEGGVDVKLSAEGNTEVKAVITNKADHTISLLKLNSFLDPAPVQKVNILQKDQAVKFEGIFVYYKSEDLPQDDFTILEAGESVEATFDIAETSDLSAGGTYTVSAEGLLPFANGKGNTIEGTLKYQTNELEIKVDGQQAAQVPKAFNTQNIRSEIAARSQLEARTHIDGSCTGNRRAALENALWNSRDLAARGAAAANVGNAAKFQEYFHTTDANSRREATLRFEGVVRESQYVNSGSTRYFCDDIINHCSGNIIAYTLPADNYMVNCEGYWNYPAVGSGCHDADQGYIVLHEMTHTPAVRSPYARDHAYGYDAIRRLTPEKALLNADTYALYSSAIRRNC